MITIGSSGGLCEHINERYDSMQVVKWILASEKDFAL